MKNLSTTLLICLFILIGNFHFMKADDCACTCEQILLDNITNQNNRITFAQWPGTNCWFMDISIFPCENRTITGMIFQFDDYKGNPCIDQTWTIEDEFGNVLWTGNPAYEAPTIGYLNPPVEPCTRENYHFRFCSGSQTHGTECLEENIQVKVSYITDPPCPPQTVDMVFTVIPSVNETFGNNSDISNIKIENGFLLVEPITNNTITKDPVKINIYDINGKEIDKQEINNNEIVKINLNNNNENILFVRIIYNDGSLITVKVLK